MPDRGGRGSVMSAVVRNNQRDAPLSTLDANRDAVADVAQSDGEARSVGGRQWGSAAVPTL